MIHRSQSSDDGKEDLPSFPQFQPVFGIPTNIFQFLRKVMSLWAAFNTFRIIRRRRRIMVKPHSYRILQGSQGTRSNQIS